MKKKRKNNVSVEDNKINVVHRVILSRVIRYIIGKRRRKRQRPETTTYASTTSDNFQLLQLSFLTPAGERRSKRINLGNGVFRWLTLLEMRRASEISAGRSSKSGEFPRRDPN